MLQLSFATVCLVLAAHALPAPAFAGSIQMLPPVESTSSATPCETGEGNKILTWDGENSIKCQANIAADASGRVGVGTNTPVAKLDVAGDIKIGLDTTACGAATIGTLRVSSGQLQYCDGTSWANVATGPIFGGIFQTYLCDASNVYHTPPADGGCRIANTVTGSCSCPTGFTKQRIGDFAVPVGGCPQPYYENRGMVQWLCVKP